MSSVSLLLVAGLFVAPPVSAGVSSSAISPNTQPETTALIPDSAPVHLGIALRVPQSPQLEALRKAQQDPSSPEYHHWLTPEEYGTRFGQPTAVYARIEAWLEAQGFTVTLFSNHTFLEAQGTALQVTKLLGIHLKQVAGQPAAVHVPDGAPRLPPDLASVILNISGLDTRVRFHHRLNETQGPPALGPQDLRRLYDSQPLLDQGYVGQGQNLVVLALAEPPSSAIDPLAIQYFLSNISDARTRVIFDTLPNPASDFDMQGGGNTEFELDVEMQSVGSPGAETITLVIPPASEVFTTGANAIASTLPLATAVSISLGGCEQGLQNGEAAALDQLVVQGSMEGQTWSAATGDTGSDDCRDGMTPSVDFPASIPEMVAAGGTELSSASFDGNGALPSYSPETVWNTPATSFSSAGAAGGGISAVFPVPAYQVGLGVTGRSLPDLSLIAGPPGASSDTTLAGQLFPVEGTSVASPLSAGFFALIASRVGCRLGDPHAALYKLGHAQFDGGPAVYHDITLGTVALDGVAGPSAGVGFDSASGWGSLDVAAMANAWPPCPPPDAGFGFDGGLTAEAPYNPCTFLACDGGGACSTLAEGPTACLVTCALNQPGACAAGTVCSNQTLFDAGSPGLCVPGCASNTDCLGDAGNVCDLCQETCVTPGSATANVGDACTSPAQCPTGGSCLTQFFPGGYCALPCDPSLQLLACACPAGAACVGNPQMGGECLASCRAPGHGCDRAGYACQPDGDNTSSCQPKCQLFNSGGQTFDTCQFTNTPNLTCELDSGVCGGPVAFVDAGADAGADAGLDAGTDAGADAGLHDAGVPDAGQAGADAGALPDGGGVSDAGTGTPPKSGGCGCNPGTGSPDALGGFLAVAALLRRRRRR